MTTAAETFRVIDSFAVEARRRLDEYGYDTVIRGHLDSIRTAVRDGLREALGDAEQQQMDYAAGHLDRRSRGLKSTGEPT